MKYLKLFLLSFFLFYCSFNVFSWGRKGHEHVAQIASHFLDDSTRAKVQHYLGKMTFEEASIWMDEMRSNSYYDYMRPWHYLNIEKGETYKPTSEDRDILIIMNSCLKELSHKQDLKFKNINEDLKLLFHLIGDLHQPLHAGYGIDRGGNEIQLSYLKKAYSTNLHSVWDDGIIESKNITIDSCLKLYDSLTTEEISEIQKIDLMQWMLQSP